MTLTRIKYQKMTIAESFKTALEVMFRDSPKVIYSAIMGKFHEKVQDFSLFLSINYETKTMTLSSLNVFLQNTEDESLSKMKQREQMAFHEMFDVVREFAKNNKFSLKFDFK